MESNKRKNILLMFWIISIGAISLAYYWCMIDCAYRGDDWLNANSGIGTFYYSGESIGELTLRIFKNWIAEGRLFPFSTYNYYLFAVFNTLHSYRFYLFCITLVMVLVSGLVIKKLTQNYLMTALFMTLAPMMFYLSGDNDCNPLLCYHGLMQNTVIWFMCAVLCLLEWIDTNIRIYAVLGSVFYFMSLLTYEVAYVFIVFAIFVVLYKEPDIRKAVKKMIPILIAWGGALMLNMIVRVSASGGYSGIEVAFSISKIVNTTLCMMAAAFPIYSAFAGGHTFAWSDVSMSSIVLSVAYAFIFVLAFYVFREKRTSKRERVIIYCMGASLWILPALLIGVSVRYQNEIRWGTNWLPYFVEVIGTSIILVQLCRDMYDTIAGSTYWKWMKHVLSLFLFLVIGYVALWNRIDGAHSYQKEEMNGTYTIQEALESGIAESVSDKDIIHVVQTVGSETEPHIFYSRFARKRCNADLLQSEEQYNSIDYSVYENEYIAKNLELSFGYHVFVLGSVSPDALDVVSYPYIYTGGGYKSESSVLFKIRIDGVEEDKEVSCSDILITSDEEGVIVQIPYEDVILDSIQLRDN